MASYKVLAAEVVGELAGNEKYPDPKAIHHYDLDDNGTKAEVFMFRLPTTAVPEVGSMLEGDITTEEGKFASKGRRKFKAGYSGGGGGSRGGGRQDREFGWKTNPEDAWRMGRAHSQEMAISTAKFAQELGVFPEVSSVKELTERLVALTQFWQKDAAGPAPDPSTNGAPADTSGLPDKFPS